jgi:hypothetical protein
MFLKKITYINYLKHTQMEKAVISSQEAREIITQDGTVKEWNQNTYEWINEMFNLNDNKWRWIFDYFGIAYWAPDGTLHAEDRSKQVVTHRDIISRNTMLKNEVVELQAQINQMNERITHLESNMARTNSASTHNSLEDKKDIKF